MTKTNQKDLELFPTGPPRVVKTMHQLPEAHVAASSADGTGLPTVQQHSNSTPPAPKPAQLHRAAAKNSRGCTVASARKLRCQQMPVVRLPELSEKDA